jgi:succinate dehydrogenase / fumarate reductase cytochrome b subunit
MTSSIPQRTRPLSPHIQIYRPQLTSVLSIVNRITGVVLSFCAVGLVAWLTSAAAGPQVYSTVHGFIRSWLGQILLFGCTYSFFLHICGGIRHLSWDAGYGFGLRTIYASGWTVLAISAALTLITWAVSIDWAG